MKKHICLFLFKWTSWVLGALNVEYAEFPLQVAVHDVWTLQVWDANPKKMSATSWYEIGLLYKDAVDQIWGVCLFRLLCFGSKYGGITKLTSGSLFVYDI